MRTAGKYSHAVHLVPGSEPERWLVARREGDGWETRCLPRAESLDRTLHAETLEALVAAGAQTYANERAAIKAYRRRYHAADPGPALDTLGSS